VAVAASAATAQLFSLHAPKSVGNDYGAQRVLEVVAREIVRRGPAAVWLAATLAAVTLLAACGGSDEAAPSAQEPAETGATQPAPPTAEAPPAVPPAETQPPAVTEPPPAVTQRRDAIVSAAHARDYEALEGLLDPETFSYSFGESGDPIGYWQELESEAHVPIFGDIIPLVLSTRPAKMDDVYVWPAAAAKDPATWTEEDRADLRLFNADEDISSFEQAGGYLGYRAGIRKDGTWLFFVAGD
jgi:hypothetical protein